MGVFGFRMDIFIICWFLAMGMVNYVEDTTGVFYYRTDAKYTIDEISQWSGIQVGNETGVIDNINNAEGLGDLIIEAPSLLFSLFTYTLKAALFLGSILWNASFGLHTYLNSNFGVPLIWGLPIMILVNLANFLGLIELWAKIKI